MWRAGCRRLHFSRLPGPKCGMCDSPAFPSDFNKFFTFAFFHCTPSPSLPLPPPPPFALSVAVRSFPASRRATGGWNLPLRDVLMDVTGGGNGGEGRETVGWLAAV